MKFFKYFAYGSCMNVASLSSSLKIDASMHIVGKVVLPNYRLVFNYPSTVRSGGLCNIAPKKNSFVEGILFNLPCQVMSDLDEREALPRGRYYRKQLDVVHEDLTVSSAMTYIAAITMDEELPPDDQYLLMILEGMKEAKLSKNYVDKTLFHISELKGCN